MKLIAYRKTFNSCSVNLAPPRSLALGSCCLAPGLGAEYLIVEELSLSASRKLVRGPAEL